MQVVVAFGALLGIVIGFVLTRQTLAEMRLQTQTLRHQMVVTDRAWLKASILIIGTIKRRVVGGADELMVTVRTNVENVGRSTAVDVDAFVKVLPIPVRGNVIEAQMDNWREVVESTRRSSAHNKDLPFSRTVF
ncbi:MAG TPA: hypothetical protein VNT81_08040, partial [Vicinamibacterales bacterium]|nr:hypothetical protein [Vicinamibacterales bacterium]